MRGLLTLVVLLAATVAGCGNADDENPAAGTAGTSVAGSGSGGSSVGTDGAGTNGAGSGAAMGGAGGASGGAAGGANAGRGGAIASCDYAGNPCIGTVVVEMLAGISSQAQADDRNLVYRSSRTMFRIDLTAPTVQPAMIRVADDQIYAIVLLDDEVVYLTPSSLRIGPLVGGSFATDRVITATALSYDLAVVDDVAYYTQIMAEPGLFRVPLAGGTPEKIAPIEGVQLEAGEARLHLIDSDGNVYLYDPAQDDAPMLVYDGADARFANSLNGDVYVTTSMGVLRLEPAGAHEVVTSAGAHSGMHRDSSGLLINEQGGGRVLLLPADGGEVVTVAESALGPMDNARSLTANSTDVFWMDSTSMTTSAGSSTVIQRSPKCGCP